MKKSSFSPSIRSTLALLIGVTFLIPAQLLASDVAEDDGDTLVATPAKAKKFSAANELRSLTNLASQLQIHAERADGRIRKVTQLVEDSANDIAEDRNSIDFKALVKMATPKGTEEALQEIHGAHERVAAAYEIPTQTVILKERVKELEQEAEKIHQDMLRLKEQAGKSGDVEKALEDQIVAATAKQAELEKVTQERDEIQTNLQAVTKQKETAEQEILSFTQGLKALGVIFDGKDVQNVDGKTARDMLQAIQMKLTELIK